jgi:hypothetical protein
MRFEVLAEVASTRRIWAAGAIAWAHWTSRLISSAQPEFAFGYLVVPVWLTFVKQPFAVVHAGRPNLLLKTARSDSAVGSS